MKLSRNTLLMPFEIKSAGDAGEVKGLGAAFNNVDGGKDVIHPGSFKKSIDFYHESKSMPAMFWNHEQTMPCGDWRTMQEDAKGLDVVGDIWHGKGMPHAEMAYNVARGTGMKGMSIGYKTLKADREAKTGIRHIYDVALKEISILLWPMNDRAEILSIKSLMQDDKGEFKSIRDIEEILSETLTGLSNREVKALLADGYKGLAKLRDAADSSQENASEFSAELKKLAAIMAG